MGANIAREHRRPPQAAPAYAGLLKRTPVQVRSAKRVDAILDATAAALEQGGLEALTMRSVAAGAGVPTGTIYQFFADRETLIQALAVRYVSASTTPLDHVLAAPGGWSVKVDLLVDHYADMLRSTPAIRILWLAGVMDAATRRLAIEADDQIAERLGADLSAASRGSTEPTVADWRFLVTLVSGLLKAAFATDPNGDPDVLARTKRVATLYAGDLLGEPSHPATT